MKVITGFIYYFLLSVMGLTLSLVVFAIRPLRRLIHKIQLKYQKIFNNQIVNGIIYFSFAIIGIILIESIYSFLQINTHLNSRISTFIQKAISSKNPNYKNLILLEEAIVMDTQCKIRL